MQRQIVHLLAAAVTVAAMTPTVRAETKLDPEKVKASIDGAVDYLRKMQERRTGAWPEFAAQYPGASTSLCALALLNCGVDPSDRQIATALTEIRKYRGTRQPQWTYPLAIQTMALCAATPKRDLNLIRSNVLKLEAMQIKAGPNTGCWSYSAQTGRGIRGGDNSNAQFALLALHEADRIGVNVKSATWTRALKYWVDSQHPDGSWSYLKSQGPGSATGSMTCAGIASVIICAGKLGGLEASVVGDEVKCCGDRSEDKATKAIEKGMLWLGDHFKIDRNPSSGRGGRGFDHYHFYYLYALERVGRMSSRRWIVGSDGQAHDWYRRGTEQLVSREQDPISKVFKKAKGNEANPLISTSLALLFLAKGRRPVLVARLSHGQGDDWNHHRNALESLTRYVESKWELDLTHQITQLNQATVDDLLQSPVLFLSGKEPLQFDQQERKLLREYINQGGFIFAEQVCESGAFETSLRKLLATPEMFPRSRLEQLSPDHPIFGAEEKLDASFVGKIYGIQAGCRTSVVFVKDHLSCHWELNFGRGQKQYSPKVKQAISQRNAVGINVLAYATDRKLKYKYDIKDVAADKSVIRHQRNTMVVAKLRHGGGCDQAPLALQNLLEDAARRLKLRVQPAQRMIPINDKSLAQHNLVFMHGRSTFQLTAAERKALRTYVELGGTIMADAISSNEAFDKAFRREMKRVFPKRPLAQISADRVPIKRRAQDEGFDISKVSLRTPLPAIPGKPRRIKSTRIPPDLWGVDVDGRWGVIYSPYDLSCALENHQSLEFAGYDRDDAYKIALNIVLYSLQQ